MNIKSILIKIGLIIGVIIGLLAALIFVLYLAAPKMPKPDSEITNSTELDKYLNLITENLTPPAISVAVFKDGISVYDKTFGYLDSGKTRSADNNTGYAWWSATKLFTAAAIIQLYEKGKIHLDDNVNEYLDYFNPALKNGEPYDVTIRQLLTHQSGLPSMMPELMSWLRFSEQPPVNQSDFYRGKYSEYSTLNFEPGTKSEYTNNAYLALGAVIEQASGMRYEEYVTENILIPLGMDNSGFIRTPEMLSNFAEPSAALISIYTPLIMMVNNDWFENYVIETVNGRTWLKKIYTLYTPSTGLNGPAHDLAKIGSAILNGGEFNGRRIISQVSTNLIFSTFPEGEAGTFENPQLGIGWKKFEENGITFLGHGGGGPGYGTQLAIIPEKNIVISIIANDTDIDRKVLLNTIAGIDW